MSQDQFISLVKEYEAYIKKCTAHLMTFGKSYNQILSENEAFVQKITTLENEYNSVTNSLSELQKTNFHFREELEFFRKPMSENAATALSNIHHIVCQITELSGASTDLAKLYENAMANAEEVILGIEHRADDLSACISHAENTIQVLNQECQQQKAQINRFEEIKNPLMQQLKCQQSENMNLKNQKAEAEDTIKILNEECQKCNAQLTLFEKARNPLLFQLKAEQSEVVNLKNQLAKQSNYSNDEVLIQKKTIEDLQASLDNIHVDNDQKEAHILQQKEDKRNQVMDRNSIKEELEETLMVQNLKDKEISARKERFSMARIELKNTQRIIEKNRESFTESLTEKNSYIRNQENHLEGVGLSRPSSFGLSLSNSPTKILNKAQTIDSHLQSRKSIGKTGMNPDGLEASDMIIYKVENEGKANVECSEIEEETLVGSGGQTDRKDNVINSTRLEQQIEIEELKNQLNELKSENSEKSKKMGLLETELETLQKMVKDLQVKREHAIHEIKSLQRKYGDQTPMTDASNFFNKKTEPSQPTADHVLYQGNNLVLKRNSLAKSELHSKNLAQNFQKHQTMNTQIGRQSLQIGKSNMMNNGVYNTTNIGLPPGPVNHIYVINPEKLNVFCKGLFKELKIAYIAFVSFDHPKDSDNMVNNVEKGLNICMQQVKDFESYVDEECYVDDKLTHLNIKAK